MPEKQPEASNQQPENKFDPGACFLLLE